MTECVEDRRRRVKACYNTGEDNGDLMNTPLTDLLLDNDKFVEALVETADWYAQDCGKTPAELELEAHRSAARLTEFIITQLKAASVS